MKKVRCVDNAGCKHELTIGKIYEVIYDGGRMLKVRDNMKSVNWFNKSKFKEVKEDKMGTKKRTFVAVADDLELLDWLDNELERGQEYLIGVTPIPEDYRLATKADIGKKGKYLTYLGRWCDTYIINDNYTYIVEKEPEVPGVKELTMAYLEAIFGCKVKVVK